MNPYAARLAEHSSFVFNDQALFLHRAAWKDFFLQRMGRAPSRTILEIGCSNATFLSRIASANPHTAFIGIDWKYKVLYKGASRVDREGLRNVALLRGRAQELSRIFGEAELDEIWAFFPDPWAKKAQLKHRLIQEAFLLDAARALKPRGRVHVKTDHPGYFQWALALLGEPEPELPAYDAADTGERSRHARQIRMRRPENVGLPRPSAPIQSVFRLESSSADYWSGSRSTTLFSELPTLFEKGFVEEGLPIFYLELTKKQRA